MFSGEEAITKNDFFARLLEQESNWIFSENEIIKRYVTVLERGGHDELEIDDCDEFLDLRKIKLELSINKSPVQTPQTAQGSPDQAIIEEEDEDCECDMECDIDQNDSLNGPYKIDDSLKMGSED